MWLVLENKNRATESSPVVAAKVDQVVGGVTASAGSVRIVGDQLHVVVTVTTGSSGVDAGKGWALVTTQKGPAAVPVVDPAGLSDADYRACRGAVLPVNASATCVLAFGPIPATFGQAVSGKPDVYVSYLRSEHRATWQLAISAS